MSGILGDIGDVLGDVMETLFNPLLDFFGLLECFPTFDDPSRWFRKDEGCWLWFFGELLDVLVTVATELISCVENEFSRESGCRVWWLWEIITGVINQFLCCVGAVDITEPDYLNGYKPPRSLPFVGSKCPEEGSVEWMTRPDLPSAGRCFVAPLGRFVYNTALSIADCYTITEASGLSVFTCKIGFGVTVGGLLVTLGVAALLFVVGIFVARLLTLTSAGRGCCSLCASCCYSSEEKAKSSEPCCSPRTRFYVGDIVSFRRTKAPSAGPRLPSRYMVTERDDDGFFTLLNAKREKVRGVRARFLKVESRFEPYLWGEGGGESFVQYIESFPETNAKRTISLSPEYIEYAREFLPPGQVVYASPVRS
jgi:hypothetical protein